MNYKTYLFDFDYTLADSSQGILICFRNVFVRNGYKDISDEEIKRTIGKTLEESFSILTGVTDENKLKDLKKEYVTEANTHMTSNTVLFPETLSVLTALKESGAYIGIISTKYRYRIKELINQHFPDDFFNIIIGGEDITKPKPSPEGIILALEQLHCTAEETLYIGDSTVDAETAQAANVTFAGVLHGVTTEEELNAYPHQKIMKTLSELIENPKDNSPKKTDLNKKQPKPKKEHKKWTNVSKTGLTLFILSAIIEIITFDSFYFVAFGILILLFRIRKENMPPKINKLLAPVIYFCEKYTRFLHIKQIFGFHNHKISTETTTCQNCGNVFTGNYCNQCGQNQTTARFSFRYAVKNVLGGLSNIDNGFWRTLLELLYRPGYMIKDFIAGKRITYFRPFQTLFVLAAIYILMVQIIDPNALKSEDHEISNIETLTLAQNQLQAQLDTIQNEQDKKNIAILISDLDKRINQIQNEQESTLKEESEITLSWNDSEIKLNHIYKKIKSNPFIQKVWNLLSSWAHGNKALRIICILPVFAIATRLTFCKRKFGINYNLTEHFFVQTYIAAQILLISIIYLPFKGKAEVSDLYDISYSIIFLLFWWDYKQLFNSTWLKSFLRTFLMFLYSFLIVIILAIIIAVLIIIILYIINTLNP